MSHAHDHSHSHSHPDSAGAIPRSLKVALGITFSFMIIELIGAWWTGSLALFSDALHMFTDSGSLVLSAFTLWLSKRPAKAGFTYGYQRVEILGALLNGLLIWLLSGFLIFESFERFQDPRELQGGAVALVAAIGLVANLVSLFFLHREHDHSLNLRSAYLHVASDCLGSVAAIISGVVISLTGTTWIDPAVTCLIAVLILWSSWRLVREAVEILLERAPRGISEDEVEGRLLQVPGVEEVHDLHIWTLSSGKVALSAHLSGARIAREGMHQKVLESARRLLLDEYGISHTTIQIEGGAPADCVDCT